MTSRGSPRAVFRRLGPWLLACLLPFLAACGGAPDVGYEGGCGVASSPYLPADARVSRPAISFCDGGDAWTGELRSTPWPAGTDRISFEVAGYPSVAGGLKLRALDGSVEAVVPATDAGERWRGVTLPVPDALRDRGFVLVALDASSGHRGWVGLAAPLHIAPGAVLAGLLPMALVLLLVHAWTAAAAACTPVAWNTAGRAMGGVLLAGLAAWICFGAWLLAPAAGRTVSWLVLLAPPVLLAWRLRTGRAIASADPQWLLLPALVLAALLCWVGLFPFTWSGDDWQVPASRWLGLPVDNWLPLTFARMLEAGELNRPMAGDWLSSDRPPLQTGLVLMFEPAWKFAGEGNAYQAIATWAQCLALVPMIALARSLMRSRVDVALAATVLALSPLVMVNGLFVWPKLFAAAFCAIFHIALFDRDAVRRPGLVAGIAAALAMLAHGGALFALVGSTLALLLLRRGDAWRLLRTVAPLSLLAYLPWVLYQKLLDPPGDRLLKWHFGGQVDPTTASLAEVIQSAYATIGFEGWWQARIANIDMIRRGAASIHAEAWRHLQAVFGNGVEAATADALRQGSFYGFMHGSQLLGPFALAAGVAVLLARRRHLPPGTAPLAMAVALSLAFWVVAMFLPASTVNHQGGYFMNLAWGLLVPVVLAAAAPIAFRALALLSLLLSASLYLFDSAAGAAANSGLYTGGTLLAVLALLLSIALAARRLPPSRGQPTQ